MSEYSSDYLAALREGRWQLLENWREGTQSGWEANDRFVIVIAAKSKKRTSSSTSSSALASAASSSSTDSIPLPPTGAGLEADPPLTTGDVMLAAKLEDGEPLAIPPSEEAVPPIIVEEEAEADLGAPLVPAGGSKPRSRSSATGATSAAGAPATSAKPISAGSAKSTSTSAPAPASSSRSKSRAGNGKGRDVVEEPLVVEEPVEEAIEEDRYAGKRSTRGRGAAAAAGKRKAESQLAEREKVKQEERYVEEEDMDDDEGDDGAEGVTRCVCGQDTDEMSSSLMIQCDTCKCWQHGPCVGLWGEKDCPDRYFCELCRPAWHGPGGLLRKAHRKPTFAPAPPPPPPLRTTNSSHRRSPSTTTSSRNKPRESADAALVAAFLAAEQSVNPGSSVEREREKSEKGERETSTRSPSLPAGGVGGDGKAPKKRSTMNSRDAAYDDAIAMSILGPGSAAMRARLERARGDRSERSMGADESGDELAREQSRRSRSNDSNAMDESRDSNAGGREDDEVLPAKRRRLSPSTVAAQTEDESMTGSHGGQDGNASFEMEEEKKSGPGRKSSNEAKEALPTEAEVEAPEPSPPPPVVPVRAKHPNQYTYRPKNGGATAASSSRSRASPAKRSSHPVNSTKEGATSRARDWTPLENGSGISSNSVQGLGTMGWGLPDHLKHLSSLLPSPLPVPLVVPTYPATSSPSTSTPSTHLEAPTRIRFPNKRMTMPEMKKRARNVLDYVARIQIEMSEREKRTEAVQRAVEAAGSPLSGTGEAVVGEDSLKLMDSLTKDVILFQQKYFGNE